MKSSFLIWVKSYINWVDFDSFLVVRENLVSTLINDMTLVRAKWRRIQKKYIYIYSQLLLNKE
jgi:uncharacterized membrane protein